VNICLIINHVDNILVLPKVVESVFETVYSICRDNTTITKSAAAPVADIVAPSSCWSSSRFCTAGHPQHNLSLPHQPVKHSFHYPSTWAMLTGAQFPPAELMGNGSPSTQAVNSARQLG